MPIELFAIRGNLWSNDVGGKVVFEEIVEIVEVGFLVVAFVVHVVCHFAHHGVDAREVSRGSIGLFVPDNVGMGFARVAESAEHFSPAFVFG